MNILAEFKKITTFIFDIDGVLTDGTLLVLGDGLQARQMHVKDGFGLQMAIRHGYKVFVISGGVSEECRRAATPAQGHQGAAAPARRAGDG